MKIEIKDGPSYAIAYAFLDVGETLHVERDAMAWRSQGLAVSGGVGGSSLGKAVFRKAFGGEDVLFGTYTAEIHNAFVAVAPKYPGDLACLDIGEMGPMLVQTGSLVAHGDYISVGVGYSGAKTAAVREGVSMLKLSGEGDAVVGTYGAVQQIGLRDGEALVVDSGHLVGFSVDMGLEMGLNGGARATALTGEGMVANMVGPGYVLLQTRAEQQITSWLFPERDPKRPR